jgi:hypothetical protein
MALIRENLLTVWVINTSSGSVLTEIDFDGHEWDGSDITWTRWDEDLSINGDETPEGIEGIVQTATDSSFMVDLNGRATYCFEIPLVDAEDNYPFVQAETYQTGSGVSTLACNDAGGGSRVEFSAAGEFVTFDLDITKTYSHDMAFRVSSESEPIRFSIYDGSNLIAEVDRMATGDAQNWTTLYKTVSLDGGPTALTIYANGGGWNLNWIEFELIDDASEAAADPVVSMDVITNALSLSWSGVAGATYSLQRSTNLIDGFSTLESKIPVHQETNVNVVATPDEAAFYRVLLED